MQEKTKNTLQHAGEYGNLSVAHGTIEFSADAIASVGTLFRLPPMTKIIDAYFRNDALGASTTIKIDAVGDSATTAIIAATSTSSAGKTLYSGAPLTLTEKTDIKATVAGGAATGTLDVVIKYVYIGA